MFDKIIQWLFVTEVDPEAIERKIYVQNELREYYPTSSTEPIPLHFFPFR